MSRQPPHQADPALPSSSRIYRAGTLSYTKPALFLLFGWLLWGDFCHTLFETIGGPEILRLYLQKDFHVKTQTIFIVFTLIPQLVGLIIVPIIGFKSDRRRGRGGRRLPYIIWTMPFLCIFAALLGFSDDIMQLAKEYVGPGHSISPLVAGLSLIGFLVMGFAFFNDFVNSVFQYLFADVVPREVMGRFSGLFRMVGAGAGFFTNTFFGKYALTHMKWVHIGGAMVYLVGFSLMCLFVKEGEYPPVTDITPRTPVRAQVRLFFRECFTKRIFWLVYISSFFFVLIRTTGMQRVFGYNLSRHQAMSQAHVGRVTALAMSLDGRRVLSGGADGRLSVWDGTQPQLIPQPFWQAVRHAAIKNTGTLLASGPSITCQAMTQDGTLAITGDASGQSSVWHLDSSLSPTRLPSMNSKVTAVAIAQDGHYFARAASDGLTEVWDAHRLQLLNVANEPGAVDALAFSSDGRQMACSSNNQITIYDSDTGQKITILHGTGRSYALSFMPSLAATANASADQSGWFASLWSYVQEMLCNESLYRQPATERSRIVEPDAWLLSGGQEHASDAQYAQLHIWDLKRGTSLADLKGHKQAITAITFKPDLHTVLTASLDGTMRMWDPADIHPEATDQSCRDYSGYSQHLTAFAAPGFGKLMIAGDDAGELHLWDLDAGISQAKQTHMTGFFQFFTFLLAFPCGLLVDRFHAIRVTVFAAFVVAWAPLYYYFFQRDYMSQFMAEIVKVPMYALITTGSLPMMMAIFPRDKFGQFASANAMVRQASTIVLGWLSAVLMDWLTRGSLLTENFRYAELTSLAGMVGYQITLVAIYRHWKRQGCPRDLAESASSILAAGEVPADSAPAEAVH